MNQRRGIIAGGNWIRDHVKIIDTYPAQDALANILAQSSSNGGSPYNILKDLARLRVPFPLEGIGLVGNDADGSLILKDCEKHRIGTNQIRVFKKASTSYTDVMTVRSTGRRTFFHQRGANAFLDLSHFDFRKARAKIFHLGYLLLLDRLDRPSRSHGTFAAEVLAEAQKAGLKTSIDVVSEDSRRFSKIVLPALPFVNFAFLNEFEAERSTGIRIRSGNPLHFKNLKRAGLQLLRKGVKDWVILHFPEGACAISRAQIAWQGSARMPQNKIKGTVGAGDAFAAGALLGLHEGKPIQECLRYGVCSAAACLLDPTASGGLMPLAQCLKLGKQYGFRKS